MIWVIQIITVMNKTDLLFKRGRFPIWTCKACNYNPGSCFSCTSLKQGGLMHTRVLPMVPNTIPWIQVPHPVVNALRGCSLKLTHKLYYRVWGSRKTYTHSDNLHIVCTMHQYIVDKEHNTYLSGEEVCLKCRTRSILALSYMGV